MTKFATAFILTINFLLLSQSIAKEVIAAYIQTYSSYWPEAAGRPPFSVEFIDTSIITDLYLAFATFSEDYQIKPIEEHDLHYLYPSLKKLKQKSAIKVFFSVGGWNFNIPSHLETYKLFSQMVADKETRKKFIASAIFFAKLHGFDGLDIDWEYPADTDRGGKKEDLDNYILFLEECQKEFHASDPPLLLSFCTPAMPASGVKKIFQENGLNFYEWVAKCSHFADRVNIMAYDYHGPFDQPKITGINSPLSQDSSSASTLSVENTIKNYVDKGLAPEKILLGLPAFGHSYSGVEGLSLNDHGPEKPFAKGSSATSITNVEGVLAFFEIADKIALKQLFFAPEPKTKTAYGYNIMAKEWVSFDTPETIKLKTLKAKEAGLKGVIFWSMEMDEYYWQPRFPLIHSAYEVFNNR